LSSECETNECRQEALASYLKVLQTESESFVAEEEGSSPVVIIIIVIVVLAALVLGFFAYRTKCFKKPFSASKEDKLH